MMPKPVIALIAAIGSNRAIGAGNALPWHLPEDFKHFKATTLGKPVVMGRKTFESIGRPLPKRLNVVITRQADYAAPEGVVVVTSLEQALAEAMRLQPDAAELMVIGGGEIYRQALPMAGRLYMTHVDAAPAHADAFFPEIDAQIWQAVEKRQSTESAPACTFVTYERITR